MTDTNNEGSFCSPLCCSGCFGTWVVFYCYAIVPVLFLLGLMLGSGCSGGDDTGNCMTTTCQTDAGQMMTDAKPPTQDANMMSDATNNGACAAYVGVPSGGWQCTVGGGNFDITHVMMVDDNGICRLRSDQLWCEETPPASAVLAGNFTCTNIVSQVSYTCWNNDL